MESKNFKIILFLFLLLIPFHTLVEQVISKVLVIPILSQFSRNTPTDIVVLLMFLYLIYYLIVSIKKNGYLTNSYIALITGVLLIYIYYRFIGNTWNFTNFYLLSPISYTDILIVYVTFEWIKKIVYKPKTKSKIQSSGFLFDNPLGKNDEDKLQRESYAKTICEKISATENDKFAFAIGINGDWGVGKTSFINLIKRNLKSSENIILDFNPWLNNGANSIINEFFKKLSFEVDIYNPDLSKKIEKYGKLLLQFEDSNLNMIIKPIIHLNNSNKVAQTEYQEINLSISKLNKKIVIFIDDLDRLDNDEIIEVIRIIRNTANFANTIFVAAYDRNYLVNALNKINSYNNEYFLEKIFQVELHLPDYEVNTINKWVFDLIKSQLTVNDKNEISSILFDKSHHLSIRFSIDYSDNIIRTIRDATRFANSFLLSYSHLKGEVNVRNLYSLELLKLKFPGVYNIILKEKDTFLTLQDYSNSGFSNRTFSFYSLRQAKKGNNNSNNTPRDKDYIISDYLKKNSSSVGIHKKTIPCIIEILQLIFPDKEGIYSHTELPSLSMADPKCFDRYSHYRLLNTNLSQVEFDVNLLKTSEEFNTKMIEWVFNGLRGEISERFRRIKQFENRVQFEKIIQGIFNLARIPKQENLDNDYPGYDYYDLISKIDNANNRISNHLYNNDINQYINFVKSIFETAPSPYLFEIIFIHTVLKAINYEFILDQGYLDALRLNYFNKYLNQATKIDIIVFQLYNNCDLTNVITIVGNESNIAKEKNVNINANNLFVDFIKDKDLDGFLYWIILSERNDIKGFWINPIVSKLFGGYIEFKTFLKEFNLSNYEYLEEFMHFFEECEKGSFENYVVFEFKKIPIRN